jgi:hypothetical protein
MPRRSVRQIARAETSWRHAVHSGGSRRPYTGGSQVGHVAGAARTRLRARRTRARHGDTSDEIPFAIQFSKFRNSENYQLSEKSPKIKVVEEL